MSDVFTVSFFGHRWISDLNFVDAEIRKIVKKIITINDSVEFLVGRNCDFDIVTSKIISRNQHYFNGIVSHRCVLPFPNGVYNDNNYEFYYHHYDNTEIAYDSIEFYPKSSIKKRNIDMVNRSNLCVFYVNKDEGIAWQTMIYAISQNKDIINIADFHTEYNSSPSWHLW